MSSKLSKQQLKVMDALKDGWIIIVYQSGPDVRAFMSHQGKGGHAINLRITTVMALSEKKLIKRTKPDYGSDWGGIWTRISNISDD